MHKDPLFLNRIMVSVTKIEMLVGGIHNTRRSLYNISSVDLVIAVTCCCFQGGVDGNRELTVFVVDPVSISFNSKNGAADSGCQGISNGGRGRADIIFHEGSGNGISNSSLTISQRDGVISIGNRSQALQF